MKSVYSCSHPERGATTEGSSKRTFFCLSRDRGHHPALPAVDATNGDKRGAPCGTSVGKPNGAKREGSAMTSLDKREHHSNFGVSPNRNVGCLMSPELS